MAACTWPSSSNVSQKLKKAKYLKVTRLLSRLSDPTTLHGGIVSKLPTQAWNKAKISPHLPLKTALSKRENHSTNDAFWLVESRDAHRGHCLIWPGRVCGSVVTTVWFSGFPIFCTDKPFLVLSRVTFRSFNSLWRLAMRGLHGPTCMVWYRQCFHRKISIMNSMCSNEWFLSETDKFGLWGPPRQAFTRQFSLSDLPD